MLKLLRSNRRMIPSTGSAPLGSISHPLLVLLFYTLLFTAFFAPATFSGHLLAPGDGLVQSVPAFYAPKVLWDELIAAGYPMTADPTVMAWYPLSIIFSLLPGGWNGFVISAYVLAGCFTYGYVHTLIGSRLAGAAGGVVYAMSGFMTAHLGHTTIVHTAVWLPLLVWSLEKIREDLSPRWFCAGTLAVSCAALAGHSQLFVYILCLGAAYVIARGPRSPVGWRRYYFFCALLLALGVGSSALQILPTAELAGESARAQINFLSFVSYSLPPAQLPMLLYPFLFGGYHWHGPPYYGEWNLTEVTGYAGLLPLVLAVVGVRTAGRGAPSFFWLGVALITVLLAMGDATPLASITFRLPVLKLFRAPARHFMEMSFAVSVLSGMGAAAVARRRVTGRVLVGALSAVAVTMLVCLFCLPLAPDGSGAHAAKDGATQLGLLPWRNPSVGVPLLLLLLDGVVVLYWHRRPNSFRRRTLLLLLLVFDLASFGWFYEWRYNSPRQSALTAPATARRYRDQLSGTGQRILPVRGGSGTADEIPPNISRLWGVPSASGYGPLMLSRLSRLLSMPPHGAVTEPLREAGDQSLNLLAVRYLFLPRGAAEDLAADGAGATWSQEDVDVALGAGCGPPHPDSFVIDLPTPFEATSLGLVSFLGCAQAVPDNTEVMKVSVTDVHGRVHTKSLLAGRDTAEWSYDCDDIRPHVRHQRAAVYKDFQSGERRPAPCGGHEYFTWLPLSGVPIVKRIEFKWLGRAGLILAKKVTLLNDRQGRSLQLKATPGSLMDGTKWRHVDDAGEASIYENLRAMPRAWLVPEVVNVKAEEALNIIRSGRMPGGRNYDPSQVALVEEPYALEEAGSDPAASAQLLQLSSTRLQVHTTSSSPALLVTSDVYYPGWRVTIDGQPARLLRANYVLRGVTVPPGNHIVSFEFRPHSFYYGAAVSLVSLLGLSSLLFLLGRRFKHSAGGPASDEGPAQ